jgi:hypothetical protein
MHPVVRAIGKVLRLVGISSPEDSLPKTQAATDPPSWRTPKSPEAKIEDSSDAKTEDSSK